MIVFAILGLLIGLLFMFVRQKLSALESRVNLLTDTVQTMAGFSRVEEDEDEDETDEESESEEESEEESEYFTRVGIENGETLENVCRMEKEDMKVVSDDEIELEVTEVADIKKIQLEGPDYESLSLKELKDKVADLGGPKLRTKKELLDFLKNKI
jgi:hypothetical protein